MCWGVRCTDRRSAASSLIFTRPRRARRKRVSCLVNFMCLLLFRLFQRNLFVGVLHALALVRLRRPEVANLRRGLTDPLAIDPLDDDLGLAGGFNGHAVRNRIVDQVRITQGQGQALRLDGGAITHADQLELLLVALGHARDHVRQVRTRGAGDGVQAFRTRVGFHFQMLVLLHDFDAALERQRQRALGALHRDGIRTDRGADTLREIYRHFCDSRHDETLLLSLLNDEQHFAAGAGRARLGVGHDALRRGYDRDAQAAQHLGQLILTAIDTQPRTADALDAVDDGTAVVILELDGQGALRAGDIDAVRTNVAFVLQHLEDGQLQLRSTHTHRGLARGLRVANTRQKIGNRISHAHCARLTSSPSTGPGSHRDWPLPGAWYAPDRTCDTRRENVR